MTVLFLSCEHGGNEVPPELEDCFAGHAAVLDSHRGLDIGALGLFHFLSPLAEAHCHATLSRLCIELNRSPGHPQLFSRYTRQLDARRRDALLTFHRSYWDRFKEQVQQRTAAGQEVLHVAVHSFTPVLDGVRRSVDIGLLYDPARSQERAFCHAWRRALAARAPHLRIRMNQPYKGISDGFPTALRRSFPHHYAGVELEVNQRFAHGRSMDPEIARALRGSLAEVLGGP